MINIKVFLDGIMVNGHANFKPKGEDIICSAVSAIVQGFIKSFDDHLIKEHIQNNLEPLIYFKTNKIIPREILHVLITQLQCVAHSSNNYLNLEIINYPMKGINDEK